MKLKKYKELIIFLILIPIFLWAAFLVSSRMENKLPAYSVINKGPLGTSVFFETLEKLSIPVQRILKAVYDQPVDTVQIVVPGDFDINSDDIKDWVKRGGIIVSLEASNIHVIDYGVKPEIKGGIITYSYGKGTIIAFDASFITNKALMENTNNAYELFEEIGRLSHKKIYFNETHLVSSAYNKSLWDYIPLWGRFIIFQFLLSLAAFFYYKGRRFGKPAVLYEEAERSENEYLYSASSLYRQAKCYDLITNNYYENLLRDINSTHNEWIEFWEREDLPMLNKAKQIYEFMNTTKVKRKPKEYIQIVSSIEQLNNVVKKRRDSYWKTLKRIQ